MGKSKEIIANLYTNVKFFDTICTVTDKRQREAEEIAAKADAMLIIGGQTAPIRESSMKYAPPDAHFHFILRQKTIFRPIYSKILMLIQSELLLTSTPDSIIEEVARKMTERKQMNETFENCSINHLKH